MITSVSGYLSQLQAIQNTATIQPRLTTFQEEPKFIINANERTVSIPPALQTIGVEKDHKAETVYFAIDRYFDGVDLDSKAVAVQFVNASGEEYLQAISERGPMEDDPMTFVFGWPLTYDATKTAGELKFSIRFFEIVDADLAYNWSTKVSTVNIAPGLYITDESENVNPPKETLSELVAIIEKLYKNDELSEYNYEQLSSLPTLNGITIKGTLTTEKLRFEEGISTMGVPYDYRIDYDKNIKNTPCINGVPLTASTTSDDLNISLPENLLTTDDVLLELDTASNKPVASSILAQEINAIKEELGEMTFVPLDIVSFYSDIYFAEKGSTVESILFTWKLNKVPTLLQLADIKIELLQEGTFNYTTPITETTTFSLAAADKKSEAAKSLDIIFTNGIYYGVGGALSSEEIDSTFITSLSRVLQTSATTVFDVNADADTYIYFAAPTAYGDLEFSVGGFTGGFELVKTFNYTNMSGYEENYNVYRTTNMNLGQTKVVVS